MDSIEQTLFYTLEKSIKVYRQFAQRNIFNQGMDITIDQWLILQTIDQHDDITRDQIAEKVFKDSASVTRIIDLLIEKGYVKKENHTEDSRRFCWGTTGGGKIILKKIGKTVNQNRSTALKGLSHDKIKQLKNTLESIIDNCKNQ